MTSYVHVSADGSYLTTPVTGIIRAELVSATIARVNPSVYDGDSITINGTTINVPQGYYDQQSLIDYINEYGLAETLRQKPQTYETEVIYTSAVADALSGTANVLSVLGFTSTTYATSPLVNDPFYPPGTYAVVSELPGFQDSKLVNGVDRQPTQVFLDIEELRHPYMNGFFATFPFDVQSGSVMVFNESTDCKCFVDYPRPLDKIHRLTPRWFDQYRNPFPVSGEFLLRLYFKDDRQGAVPVRRF